MRALVPEEHPQAFIGNEIDLDAARDLKEQDLRELGLPMGPRKKVLCAVAELNDSTNGTQQALETGETAPITAAIDLPAERRQVTVLFADICGYTKLSGELGAKATHALHAPILMKPMPSLNVLVALWKHIGDSVMAVFGAPVSYGNDSERAVCAAVKIYGAIQSVSQTVGRDISVHIGVACGQVVASGVGLKEKYTVTGDSVNLAPRLTDYAGPRETLISEGVKEAVETKITTEELGQLSLKGIVALVHAFEWSGLRNPNGVCKTDRLSAEKPSWVRLTQCYPPLQKQLWGT